MKRIYSETVKKWAKKLGIPSVAAGTIIGLTFLFLSLSGAITITGYSGDQVCAGTLSDPCYAYINFTANEDIFIYPIGYDPWGRETPFEFSPAVKSWKLQRSWGKSWRDIPLDKTCTGTWCGAPNNKGVSYSWVLREGKDYRVRIVAMKNNPSDEIKWAVDYEDKEYLDPTWLPLPTQNWTKEGNNVWINDSNVFINMTAISNTPIIQLKTHSYSGNIDLVVGFNTPKVTPQGAWVNPHLENVTRGYTCNKEFNYTTSSKYFWCYENVPTYDESNITNGSYVQIIYEHSFEKGFPINKSAYWEEEQEVWNKLSGPFNSPNLNYLGFNKWYTKTGININANQLYQLKLEFKTLGWEGNYKYFFGVKPSSQTLQQAIDAGTFYYIDPWTADLNPGLNFYYNMEEGSGAVLDSTGTYNATNVGPATNTTGIVNSAYDFDGTNDYLNISTTTLSQFANNISFGCWVYPTAFDTQRNIFVQASTTTAEIVERFYFQASGELRYLFSSADGSNNYWTTTNASMSVNNWYFLFINGSGGGATNNYKMWVNGVYVGANYIQNGPSRARPSGYSPAYIGWSEAISPMKGKMDECGRWFDVADEARIAQLYNSGSGITYTDDFPPEDTCTYSSGDWNVVCNDNCSITDAVELGGNDLIIDGSEGNFDVRVAITNFGEIRKHDVGQSCELRIYSGGSLDQ